jgi:hypothetical protein
MVRQRGRGGRRGAALTPGLLAFAAVLAASLALLWLLPDLLGYPLVVCALCALAVSTLVGAERPHP